MSNHTDLIFGLHLQATDGEGEAATEFIFHNMPDGSLFIEVWFSDEYYKVSGSQHYQATINSEMKRKLIKHLVENRTDNWVKDEIYNNQPQDS